MLMQKLCHSLSVFRRKHNKKGSSFATYYPLSHQRVTGLANTAGGKAREGVAKRLAHKSHKKGGDGDAVAADVRNRVESRCDAVV